MVEPLGGAVPADRAVPGAPLQVCEPPGLPVRAARRARRDAAGAGEDLRSALELGAPPMERFRAHRALDLGARVRFVSEREKHARHLHVQLGRERAHVARHL